MDDEENIQNTLVDILTQFDSDSSQDQGNGSEINHDFEYICSLIRTNQSSKILRLAVQTLEKVKH
jgi:hypothetical protein